MRTLLFLFGLALVLMMKPALAGQPRIVVPSRDIARGEIVTDSDLTYLAVTPDRLSGGAVTDPTTLSGHEARRFLRAGEPVRPSDVRMPVLVDKGSTVTMIFKAPGITLTGVGKAMSEGGMGEMITVLNPVSYRQVTCIVTGPGQVEAGQPQPLAANMTERLAVAQTNLQGTTP